MLVIRQSGRSRDRPNMSEFNDFLLPNAPTCIVACSASEARMWRSVARFGEWTTVKEMHHPAATRSESDMASDRPGRSFDSFGSGRHAMSPGSSAHEHELTIFATEVADTINRSFADGDFAHIVLIADPKFLGSIRGKLSSTAADAVVLEAPKNLTHLNADEIRQYLQ